MPDLEWLDLSENALSGPIPDFSNLPKLKSLYLDWNALSGPVPDFNNLANLVRLNLSNNTLSGSVPDFSNLANLNSLDLDWNELSGPIPDFSNIAHLEWLHLDWNELSGSVPDFSNIANLKYLYLSSNNLSGFVPDFSNIANLNTLALDRNALSGSIPDFSNLAKVSNLDLSNNELSGSVPVFSNLIRLTSLYLNNNQLTFSGLEQNIDADLYMVYAPQACIPISQNDNILSVSAGGTLSNNTYTWFKDGKQLAEKVGDSTLTISQTGIYNCEIVNSIATELTLCTDDFVLEQLSSSTPINESDSLELVRFYEATEGDNWNNKTGWLVAPVAEWEGIVLSETGTRVKEITLVSKNLKGALTDLNLPDLTVLNLGKNALNGTIPDFSNLPNLIELKLYSNDLSGEIPDFTNLPNLTHLLLSDNQLSGQIPDFTNLVNLNYLSIDHNELSGAIPDFTNLVNLTYLTLSDNELSGAIPDFNNLPNLIELILPKNQLSGQIPDFSNLPNLVELKSYSNQLSGEIPDFTNLPNLIELKSYSNQLSGEIPDFTNLPKLENLDLSRNQLSSQIPNFIGLSNLTYLDLSSNQLSGLVPDFSEFYKLMELDLSNNQLSGKIPNFNYLTFAKIGKNQFIFSDLEEHITNLIPFCYNPTPPYECLIYSPQACIPISQNDSILSVSAGGTLSNNTYTWFMDGEQIAEIVGDSTLTISKIGTYSCEINNSIATELTLCTDDFVVDQFSLEPQINESDYLELLRLYNATDGENWTNKDAWLIAPVKEWHGVQLSEDGRRITKIELNNNNLTGELPDLNLPDLETLNLAENEISGHIPNFKHLTKLKELHLDNNRFYGGIPDFNNLTELQALQANNNNLSGTIPTFTNLPNLQKLELHNNQLTSTIPYFTNLPNLITLNLGWNKLSGDIPDFTKLNNLQYLHLEGNQLSGTVPDFSNLSNLIHINLSNNQLTFAGLAENINAGFEMNYTSQACIAISRTNNTLSVSAGGTLSDNTYNWYRDGQLIAINKGENILNISKSGTYSCKITNSIATKLTLCTDDLLLRVKINESDSLELRRLYNVIDGDNWTSNGGWLTAPVSDWHGRNLNDFSAKLSNVNTNLSSKKIIQLSPNPISINQTLNITYPNQQPILIQLFDISGKMILEQQSNGQNQHYIQIPDLAVGAYFVKIVEEKMGKYITDKLLVIN